MPSQSLPTTDTSPQDLPNPIDPKPDLDNRRYKRCFHRVVSGLEKGGDIRLITLTSSPEAPPDIQRSFRRLIGRLRRRKLLRDYIKVIEYTQHGAQHIHLLFRGSFIEQKFLSSQWQAIHQSPIVDIRRVRRGKKDKRNMAGEMAKYMAKEQSRRYSWSWNWVYKGFCRVWQDYKRRWAKINLDLPYPLTFSHMLHLWQRHLQSHSPPFDLFLSLTRAGAGRNPALNWA